MFCRSQLPSPMTWHAKVWTRLRKPCRFFTSHLSRYVLGPIVSTTALFNGTAVILKTNHTIDVVADSQCGFICGNFLSILTAVLTFARHNLSFHNTSLRDEILVFFLLRYLEDTNFMNGWINKKRKENNFSWWIAKNQLKTLTAWEKKSLFSVMKWKQILLHSSPEAVAPCCNHSKLYLLVVSSLSRLFPMPRMW